MHKNEGLVNIGAGKSHRPHKCNFKNQSPIGWHAWPHLHSTLQTACSHLSRF